MINKTIKVLFLITLSCKLYAVDSEYMYISKNANSTISFEKELYTFDSDVVLPVWSKSAERIYRDFAFKNNECEQIYSMEIYRNWLEINLTCNNSNNAYLERVSGNWIVVYDECCGDPNYYTNPLKYHNQRISEVKWQNIPSIFK